MKSKIIYKKNSENKYESSSILFDVKESFLKRVTDEPLYLMDLVLKDKFKDYLVDILSSNTSQGGGTDELDIDFHDGYAYVMSEVWYLFADRVPEKLKIKKYDLLQFINIWYDLQSKKISEIMLQREDNKLIIEGNGVSYYSKFSLTEPKNDFLFSFTKLSKGGYRVSKDGCGKYSDNNYIVLDIMSNILQEENLNEIIKFIKDNKFYKSKGAKLIIDSEDNSWININSVNYLGKSLKISKEDNFIAFLEFWQWSTKVEKADKINLMIEDYLLTLHSNYLSIVIRFELENKY